MTMETYYVYVYRGTRGSFAPKLSSGNANFDGEQRLILSLIFTWLATCM